MPGYRLPEKSFEAQELSSILIKRLTKSRAENYLGIAAADKDFPLQVDTSHMNHRQIGDNQVKTLRPDPESLDGAGTAISRDDIITLAPKHLPDHIGQVLNDPVDHGQTQAGPLICRDPPGQIRSWLPRQPEARDSK
jgi:hypothetical protein